MSLKSLKVLYCAYVRSSLEYASQIWNPRYKDYVTRLEKIQKKFIRFLRFKFHLPKESYEMSCKRLHLLPLYIRREAADISYLINIINGKTDCSDLVAKLKFYVPSRLPRHHSIMQIPLVKTNYRQNSFFIRASNSLNKIYSDSEFDPFSKKHSNVNRYLTVAFVNKII